MSINSCIFMGNLGADPDLRYLTDGREVVNISIACSERWKDKNGVEQEQTEWVRCVGFGKRAKVIAEHFKKGSQIHVTTKCRTRKWQNQEGKDQCTTEFVIQDFQFCGQRSGGGNDAKAQQQAAAYDNSTPPASAYADAAGGDFDDDIPFLLVER